MHCCRKLTFNLELDRKHELFIKLQQRFQENKGDKTKGDYAELSLGYAFLAEGAGIPESTKFNRTMIGLMLEAL